MRNIEIQTALQQVPVLVRDSVALDCDELQARAGELRDVIVKDRLIASSLPRVLCTSRFVLQGCRRSPDLVAELCRSGELTGRISPGGLAKRFEDLRGATDEVSFMRELRRHRHREMMRIAWRDLAGWSDLEESLRDLSDLADACIRESLRAAERRLAPRFGQAQYPDGRTQELAVIAMGKLGGRELNFSSDIDLVFVFPEGGTTSGPNRLSNEDYFTRQARLLIRYLDELTDDGFVFRVDTRLRPFGEAGALVYSLAALESYLQQHGRDWERYAYVKARAITGEAEPIQELLRPFVYRRYLDYGVFESLRDMKNLIAQEVQRRDLVDNIKLGPGGIREIEFIAQSYQLIRGGSRPKLQQQELLRTYPLLAQTGDLTIADADVLLDAYRFLRQLENRLQAWDDHQTHSLPREAEDRQRIAFAMGFEDWPEFRQSLSRHQENVGRCFQQIVFAPLERAQDVDTTTTYALWENKLATEDAEKTLRRYGFDTPEKAMRTLQQMRRGRLYAGLGERGRTRLDVLIAPLLKATGETADPETGLARIASIIEAVGRRTAYLALLRENPSVLRRLVELTEQSPFLADQIARHPLLLDELIDPRIFTELPSRERFEEELEQRFTGIAEDDLERQMEALRQFQRAAIFRVAIADLTDLLPLMKVSDRLTDIAELLLQRCIELAWTHLVSQYGVPTSMISGELRLTGFAIIGYGKLGGIELGYTSDLDLVFLHDSAGEQQQTQGPKIIPNAVFFTRLGQRIIHLLSTPTPSGLLYSVDMRLRPSGGAGLLVTSAAAFEEYQLHQAWTWEHQALLRARPVAGDARVGRLFGEIRRSVLDQPRDPLRLRCDVVAMRQRILEQHVRAPAGWIDLKHERGGLTDIEFLVQYWILCHAHAQPSLLDWSDNIRQMETLLDCRVLRPSTAALLSDSYREYRHRLHRLSLAGEDTYVRSNEFVERRAAIRDLWDEVFADATVRA